MNIPVELINLIEPYTRRIQDKVLLDDISNYVKTLKEMEILYTKIINKKYNSGRYRFEYDISIYSEILTGLTYIHEFDINRLYFKYIQNHEIHQNAINIVRKYWANINSKRRLKVLSVLTKNAYTKPMRPSDSLIYHGL